MEIQLTARRPYLLRAFYDWMLDNQLVPYLLVDIYVAGVEVPLEYARDGQIVLNIAPHAVGDFSISNEQVQFKARFGGISQQIMVPMAAVLAIYARENGIGTMFEPEPAYSQPDSQPTHNSAAETVMSVVEGDRTDNSDDDPTPPPTRGKRPSLRVVK